MVISPARGYYGNEAQSEVPAPSKPNIYLGSIDGDAVLLVQVEPRPSHYGYRHQSDRVRWTNMNIEEQQIIWTISSEKCTHYGFRKLIIHEPTSIPSIPKRIFDKLNVLEFQMTNVGLQFITSEDFEKGYLLDTVNLSNNSIVSVPSFAFTYTPQIRNIDLSNNSIERIAEDAFEKNPAVAPFKEFPYGCHDEYKSLMKKADDKYLGIEVLNLDNNRLTVVSPKWFQSLKYLYKVSLASNRIQTFDVQLVFPNNPKLEELYLSKNLIRDITKIMSKSSIKMLSLTSNPVEIPRDIYADKKMIMMWNTSHVDSCLTISPEVIVLDAGKNGISSVIAENPTASNLLTVLKLDNNRLTTIVNITVFRSLEKLILPKNLFLSFEAELFAQLPSLEEVDLSYNKIEHLNFNIQMPNLKKFYIAGNDLTTLDSALKNLAPQLHAIDLRYNNWHCEYLTTLMLLLHFDGVRNVPSEFTDPPEFYKLIKYDDNIKGVNCYNEVESTTAFPQNDAKLIADLKDEVQQMLDDKLGKLQKSLVEMMQKIGKN